MTFAAKGLEPRPATRADADDRRRIASGGERRDDWRFRATTAGTRDGDRDGADRRRRRCGRAADSGAALRPAPRSGLERHRSSAPAKQTAEVTIPAASNPAARTVSVSLAPSMAGSLLGALDFLTSYPVRLHRADAVELPPERARDARADAAEARADRTAVGCSIGRWPTGLQPARRLPARRWRVGMVEDGREPSVHDGVRAVRPRPKRSAPATGSTSIACRTARARSPRCTRSTRAPSPISRRTWPTSCAARRPSAIESDTVGGDQRRRRVPARRRATSCGSARDRDVAVRPRAAAADAGRGEGRARQRAGAGAAGEAQTTGELSWWASDRDPLLFDFVDTSVEATAPALQALARRDPSQPAARSRACAG